MSVLIETLLEAPDSELDACMFPLIEKWNDPPTSLQVLEVLDECVHSALANGFVITLFEALLDKCLAIENKTIDDILPSATWRDRS